MQNSPKTAIEQVIEKAETLSTSLRAKIINYLVHNRGKWQDSWAPDGAANETTEGGPPALELESFIEALQRPKRRACGLCLAGKALQQKCIIVVWQYTGRAGDTHNKQ